MKTKRFLQFSVIIILVLMTLSPGSVNAQSPQVLYAVQGGQTTGLCESWANACEFQFALTSAVSDQEIWVAAGVYKPGTARTDTFQLKSGVGLYGGFVGTETTREERNWETNKTILSGDIDNNDINIDGNFIAETTADIQGENAYHIATGSGTDNTSVLDGFVITAGQSNDSGGGMYNYYGNPTLINTTFSANSSDTWGGGMYTLGGYPNLLKITFFANSANYGGGGLYSESGSPTLANVIFSTNASTSNGGGGMFIAYSNATLTNITFYNNSAPEGGGLKNYMCGSPVLTNVTFHSNMGGMFNFWCNPILNNVTISGNNGGGITNETSNPTIQNSIVWNNSGGDMINRNWSSPIVTYSDIQG